MALAADADLRPPSAHQLWSFLGLTVRKIWHILCVCVSRPVTLKLVCSVARVVGNPPANFVDIDYSFSIYGPLGQHGSDWSRDLVTLTFDLAGHGDCGWCGSSSSICTSSLKFIGLPIRKIWRMIYVSINGPDDPNFWLVRDSHQRLGTFLNSKFGRARPLGSRRIRYVRDGQTDVQTKATLIAPFPSP